MAPPLERIPANWLRLGRFWVPRPGQEKPMRSQATAKLFSSQTAGTSKGARRFPKAKKTGSQSFSTISIQF
jgi:hypothetical protein